MDVGRAAAWAGIAGVLIALVTLVVTILTIPEAHDWFFHKLTHPNEVSHQPTASGKPQTDTSLVHIQPDRLRPEKTGRAPLQLARFVTFAVSGSLQQDYAFSRDSVVVIDRETGLEIDSTITVLGPNTKEVFTARAAYNLDSMWQWQSQGSLGGTLDFQNKPYTFVGYSGGQPLTNSAYNTPTLGHIITSSDTILRPVASSETYP